MALRHGKNITFLFNAVNVSGDANEITPKMETDLGDVSAGGSTGHKWYPGLTKDSFTLNGLFEDTLVAQLNALVGLKPGYAGMILYGTGANVYAVGDMAAAVNELLLKSHVSKAVVTDVNRITANFEVENYPFDAGVSLLAGVPSKTGAYTGTIYDSGSETSSGANGYIQLIAFSGSTSVTIVIQHGNDSGLSDASTLMTLGTALTATTTAFVQVTGTVKRYVRVLTTVVGSPTYSFAVAFMRK